MAQFLGLLHPDDRGSVEAALGAAFASDALSIVEYRIVLPDGTIRWMMTRGRTSQSSFGAAPILMGITADVTDRKEKELQLERTLAEVQSLRAQLEHENVYLRDEVATMHGHTRLVAGSAPMRRVMVQAEQVAGTGATVLLLGETGTGKELLASVIHDLSPRRARTMVSVNCAAMPAALMESELFGREKGAYTGALSRQIGRFELADGSSLFLDEIGDMPLEVQAKLLRVLQERTFERLGSPKPISVDVRIIAATNRDLEKAVQEGRFREDLYYRLNVFPITVPPLRARREDIPQLVATFVKDFSESMGKKVAGISKDSMNGLLAYHWPGNVRELRNVVERAMITATGPIISMPLPDVRPAAASGNLAMHDVEAAHIRSVLELTGWRVRGRNGTAELLQMNPSTLESRMLKLGIRRPGR